MFTYLSDINRLRNEKKQRSDEESAVDDIKKRIRDREEELS